MTVLASDDDSALMTPNEVANVFRVHPKTVARWANQGLLRSVRTCGGHRRFPRADVQARLTELDQGLPLGALATQAGASHADVDELVTDPTP